MKHNIRINGSVTQIDCELGSGIFDKHGKEIFEGDRVTLKNKVYLVIFRDGDFILDDGRDIPCFISGVDYEGKIEIVGHIGEEQNDYSHH